MVKRKRAGYESLLEAVNEAELLINEEESVDLNDNLRELLNEYLYKGNHPFKKELIKDYELGMPLTGENGIRKKLAAIDMEFFGRAYLPHYFVRKSPVFHRELDAIWQDGVMKQHIPLTRTEQQIISRMQGCHRAVAAPRGHAKSTNLTFKGSLHAMLYAYKHYLIILSDSSEQAESFLDAIRVEFEENERIEEDFGNLVGSKVWNNKVLLTKSNIKVEAIGSGKKIRGRKHRNWRPDLIILDDIENDENVRTPEQRSKLENWFYKAVSKAGDDYTDIVYIGTLLHYEALLAKVLNNPSYQAIKYKAVISFSKRDDLWDEWESLYTDLSNAARAQDAKAYFEAHKHEMLEGTKVLWEEKLPYYDLMVMKVSEGEAAFNSEEQNEPINPEDCMFLEQWLQYYDEAEVDFKSKDFEFIGFLDPSLGKSKKSDFSGIVTLAKNKSTGLMYVVDADGERRHPDKIITDVLEKEKWLRRRYGMGYKKFGCEINQFQWFLKEELKKASAKAGLYLPIEEVNQVSDKYGRIQTLQPDVKNGYILFNRRHRLLIDQLLHYPMSGHDDMPDALEGARTLARKTKRFKILDKKHFGG